MNCHPASSSTEFPHASTPVSAAGTRGERRGALLPTQAGRLQQPGARTVVGYSPVVVVELLGALEEGHEGLGLVVAHRRFGVTGDR